MAVVAFLQLIGSRAGGSDDRRPNDLDITMDLGDLSRRDLLAAVGGAGTAGVVLGTGTAAVLADEEELLGNVLAAGTLDLEVAWATATGASGSSEGDATVVVPIDDDHASGSVAVSVALPGDRPNNPAYPWLRLACPPSTDLVDDLLVTLRYDCGDGGVLAEGTLYEVADALRNGVALDGDCASGAVAGEQACLAPGETVDLALDWRLDDDFVGEAEAAFGLEVVGRQCRSQPGTTNPFPSVAPCEAPPREYWGVSSFEIYARVGEDGACVSIGKVELDDDYCGQVGIADNYVAPGTYTLYPEAGECEPTGYAFTVTETREKLEDGRLETTALAFEVVEAGTDVGPELCRVDVKGGSSTITYDGDDLDGNATDGLLYAPRKSGGGS